MDRDSTGGREVRRVGGREVLRESGTERRAREIDEERGFQCECGLLACLSS